MTPQERRTGQLLVTAAIAVLIGLVVMFAEPGWTPITVTGLIVALIGDAIALYAALTFRRE